MADDSTNKVVIEVVLDDGSVAKGFANIKSSGEATAKGLGKAFSINGFADLNAAVQLASRAFDIFKSVLSDGIKEAIDGEQANLKLGAALKSVPGVTNEAVKSFKEFSSALSEKIAVDDDVINSNAAVLASIGRLSGQGLKDATQAALDLSAGLGVSLETAFQQVAKAAEGNVGAFKKLGFEFSKGADDAKVLDQALAQINSRFGGLSQLQANQTFQGAVNQLKVAFDDSNQALGELITKSPAVREIFKFIAEAFRASTDQIKQFSESGGLDRLIQGLVQFASGVNTYLIKPLEVFINFGKEVFNLFLSGIQDAIAGFGGLGGVIGDLLNKIGVDNEITRSLQAIRESTSDVAEQARNDFKGFREVLETPLSDQIGTTVDNLAIRLANAKPVVDASTLAIANQKEEVKQLTDAIYEGIIANQQFESSGAAISAAFMEISNNFKAAALEIGITAKTIAKSIIQGVGTGAANAFSAFGKAIVEGTNALDAFVNSLLGSLGQMAVQVGSQFILQGIAYSLAGLPNGPALIGAGAALATFGGVLSAIGGKSGSPAAPVSGGGADLGNVGGGGIDFTNNEVDNATDVRTPKQELVVNINGDVLGDDSSGRKIVELINAAFDTSGVNLRQGLV